MAKNKRTEMEILQDKALITELLLKGKGPTEIAQENVWGKAIQHLRDEGELVNEPKDIGPLMKEIKDDLFREQEEYIKQVLFNHYKKDIFNQIKRGFPEYYKKLLRDRVRES